MLDRRGTRCYGEGMRHEEAPASDDWIAFADQRPEPQYDSEREGPTHPSILVTNNLSARNRWGQMSHLWLVSMVHYHDERPHILGGRVLAELGEITAFAQPGDMPLRNLTHWRPAVPEEWPESEALSARVANRILQLEAFVAEWSDRFGFLADENPRDSIESIDEVADILNNRLVSGQIDGLSMAADESQEIIAELSAALATACEEGLVPCVDPCPGHLGPRSKAVFNESLKRWRDLEQEVLALRAANEQQKEKKEG